MIALGTFLMALGLTAFIIPARIIGGGVTGIATLVFYSLGFPVGITVFVINIVLILIAVKILGAQFGVKTVYAIVFLSVFIYVLQRIITEPIVHEAFMATLIGAILSGLGMGIAFAHGGSTGGQQTPADRQQKGRPHCAADSHVLAHRPGAG